MRRLIKVVAVVAVVVILSGSVAAQNAQRFSDVPADHPAHDAIEWAAATGLTLGYDDGTFKPSEPLSKWAAGVFMERFYDQILKADSSEDFTRSDMMQLLWTMSGAPDAETVAAAATDAPTRVLEGTDRDCLGCSTAELVSLQAGHWEYRVTMTVPHIPARILRARGQDRLVAVSVDDNYHNDQTSGNTTHRFNGTLDVASELDDFWVQITQDTGVDVEWRIEFVMATTSSSTTTTTPTTTTARRAVASCTHHHAGNPTHTHRRYSDGTVSGHRHQARSDTKCGYLWQ